MTVVMFVLGVLIFTVGLAVSVGLHELGHLVPGKLFDVKVTQYFVGFGKTLWSRQRGETEYGVKAIPLGGYCKMVGMVPPAPDDEPGRVRSRNTGMFSQMVSDVRRAEYEDVDEDDRSRLFYDKPWWKRVVIMGSGVAINLVLAFLLFAVVFMGHGVQQPTTTVESVSGCVIAVTKANLDEPRRSCTAADPVSPARKAGFRAGDDIVSFNGQRTRTWEDVQAAIRSNGDRRAAIVVRRDGHDTTLTATTAATPRADPANPQRIRTTGFLGVTPTAVLERQGPGYVVSFMVNATGDTLRTIGSLPVKLYHVARAAVGLEKRDPAGPMSVVGAGRVAGELTAQHQVPLSDRFFSVLLLLGGLNLFLGLINLVPLPPFDGGGIATTLYEAVRRGLARMLHRPDPGSVDSAKLLPVTYVMAGVILVMSVVLIYADIVAPVTLS